MIASPQNTKLYSVDNGDQFDGSNMTSYLQRTGINVLATDRFGRLVTDNERRKLWNGVWPRISGSGTIDIRAGSQEVVGGATSWADYKTYTIGSDIKVDFCASGRFMALEFRSTGNQEWDLMNYDIDVQPLGRF